jgi:tyrosine-protein kinase
MELRHYVQILWRWLWLIILGAVLAGGAAYLVSSNAKPVYRATTTLYVSQSTSTSLTDYTSVYVSQQMAATYSQLLQKRSVFQETMVRLGLPPTTTVDAAITVSPVRDTQLINLSVDSRDPALAWQIANELPQAFIKQYNALQSGRYAETLAALQAQMDETQKNIDDTLKSLDEVKASTSLSADAKQSEVARLETSLATYRSSYSSLLGSFEQARMADARSLSSIVVAEPAGLPDKPIGYGALTKTLLAAIIGAILATGAALGIEYLDDTIKTPADAEEVAGLATLGGISRLPSIKRSSDALVTSRHPNSSATEAYRMVRTMLRMSGQGADKGYLVTSAEPQEGKSTIVANLGVVMAEAGITTILVDADLRRPVLHKIFGVQNARGLATLLLRDDLDVASTLVPTGVDGLKLLPSGVTTPNPAELLASDGLERVIAQLKQLADVVIFDSPPVLAVADTAILAARTQRAILVVNAGRTRSDDLRRAKDTLALTGITLQGVILNRVRPRRGSYGYYGYYSDDGESKEGHRRKTGRGLSLPFFNRRAKAQPDESTTSADG